MDITGLVVVVKCVELEELSQKPFPIQRIAVKFSIYLGQIEEDFAV